jgi:hypothetical protein
MPHWECSYGLHLEGFFSGRDNCVHCFDLLQPKCDGHAD